MPVVLRTSLFNVAQTARSLPPNPAVAPVLIVEVIQTGSKQRDRPISDITPLASRLKYPAAASTGSAAVATPRNQIDQFSGISWREIAPPGHVLIGACQDQ